MGWADALVGAMATWWIRVEVGLITERISFSGHQRGAIQMYVWVKGKVNISTQVPKELCDSEKSRVVFTNLHRTFLDEFSHPLCG